MEPFDLKRAKAALAADNELNLRITKMIIADPRVPEEKKVGLRLGAVTCQIIDDMSTLTKAATGTNGEIFQPQMVEKQRQVLAYLCAVAGAMENFMEQFGIPREANT